jgi:hypothetical protein
MEIPAGYILIKETEYQDLKNQIEELRRLVAELQNRLNQNSGNSHKPPSTDGYKKHQIVNLRTPSGKKPGGQPGHEGTTLKMTATPDKITLPSETFLRKNNPVGLVHHKRTTYGTIQEKQKYK